MSEKAIDRLIATLGGMLGGFLAITALLVFERVAVTRSSRRRLAEKDLRHAGRASTEAARIGHSGLRDGVTGSDRSVPVQRSIGHCSDTRTDQHFRS